MSANEGPNEPSRHGTRVNSRTNADNARLGSLSSREEVRNIMTNADRSTDDLLIEIQDELMRARFRFDALKLIFKSLDDTRTATACQEVSTSPARSLAVCRRSSTRSPGVSGKTRNRPCCLILPPSHCPVASATAPLLSITPTGRQKSSNLKHRHFLFEEGI